MIDLIKLFEKIKWAENGGIADFSEGSYKSGWAFLGDDTPTVQDFNFVQQMNDKKDKWLYNQINEVLKSEGLTATEQELDTLLKAIKNIVQSYSTPKEISGKSDNAIDETGHSHKIVSANTERKGIVQLTEDLTSESSELGLTAKAGKRLKELIDALTRSLGNYIPNSKKSSAVDSPSADMVATSAAVKTANDNANGRVSRNGDNLNGVMRSKHFGMGGYAAQYTADAPFMVSEINTINRDAFHPFIKGRVRSKGDYGEAFSFGYTTFQPGNPRNVGEFGRGAICLTADSGDSKVWTFEHGGDFVSAKDIVDGSGVVLSVLNSLFHNFRNKFTVDNYSGSQSVSQVYRIPLSANKGLKIYASYLTIAAGIGTHRFRLAESLGNFRIGFAVDAGAGMLRHGVVMESDTSAIVHSEVFNAPHGVNVLLIGEYHY